MDLKSMVKGIFGKRGGAGAAKEDAAELRDIAQSDTSVTNKGSDAAEAVREPGAREPGAS